MEEEGTRRFLLLENASKIQTEQRAEERGRAPANTTCVNHHHFPLQTKRRQGPSTPQPTSSSLKRHRTMPNL